MQLINERIQQPKELAIVVLTLVLGWPISASSENPPTVHYELSIQNGLPFEVELRSLWSDGSENTELLTPCRWTTLTYPKRKFANWFHRKRVYRRLLDSLHVTGANGYHQVISGPAFEESMLNAFKRRGRSHALELALSSRDGELNLKPRWVRCVRLLNGYDHETTIELHYDDGSRKHFTVDARRIIFFGTAELGIFERVLPSFWDRLRLQLRYHDALVQRMVIRAGSNVLHEIDRKEIKRDFLRFYAHPSDFRGTCMRLDGDGFSFVDSCAALFEFCDQDGCRFESRPRNCCAAEDPVGKETDSET